MQTARLFQAGIKTRHEAKTAFLFRASRAGPDGLDSCVRRWEFNRPGVTSCTSASAGARAKARASTKPGTGPATRTGFGRACSGQPGWHCGGTRHGPGRQHQQPGPRGGHRYRRQLHRCRCRCGERCRAGRHHHLQLRRRPGHHCFDHHRQSVQRQAGRGARWRRQGNA